MVEVLKQDQYRPMPVEKQVAVVFAGISGQIERRARGRGAALRGRAARLLEAKQAQLLKEIADKKALDDELKKKLSAAIAEFKKGFKA